MIETRHSPLPDACFIALEYMSHSELAQMATVNKAFAQTVREFPIYCYNKYRTQAIERLVARVSSVFYPGTDLDEMANKIRVLTKRYLATHPQTTLGEISLPQVLATAQREEEENEQNFIQVTDSFFTALRSSFLREDIIVPLWSPAEQPALARRWWNEVFPTICNRPSIQNLLPTIWAQALNHRQIEITQYLISSLDLNTPLDAPFLGIVNDVNRFETFAFAAFALSPNTDHLVPRLLNMASQIGSLEIVQVIISTNRFHEISGDDLGEALWAASNEGHVAIVDQIIRSNRFHEISGDDLSEALWAASRHGHVAIVNQIIHKISGNDLGRVLLAASNEGDVALVNQIIRSNRFHKISATGENGLTKALLIAIRNGHLEIFTAILTHDHAANIPTHGESGIGFLLTGAILARNLDAVNAIIASTHFTKMQSGPLDVAYVIDLLKRIWKSFISSGHIAKLPIDDFCVIEIAIQTAASKGYVDIMKTLIAARQNLAPIDKTYGLGAALYVAALKGHTTVVEELIANPRFNEIPVSEYALYTRPFRFLIDVIISLFTFLNFTKIHVTDICNLPMAVQIALLNKKFDIALRLIEHPRFGEISMEHFKEILLRAAAAGNPDVITALMQNPHFNKMPLYNVFRHSTLSSAIFMAAAKKHPQIVNLLLASPKARYIPPQRLRQILLIASNIEDNQEVVTALEQHVRAR